MCILDLAAPDVVADPAASSHPAAAFSERTHTFHLDEGARVHVNWPAAPAPPGARSHLILFALPNGNTIEQTVGCQKKEGIDWHYSIQHIGAQTRRLREIAPGERFVIAYLEADGRSWPAWKGRHADHLERARRILDRVQREAGGPFDALSLAGHSGGGSFLFACIDSVDRIPDRIERIAFLDANYAYDTPRHADKLIAWLRADARHILSVIAYDDRHITLNGRPVLSRPDRGTWGATQRMIERLGRDFDLTEQTVGDLIYATGLDGRLEFIRHVNPANKILHTALVGDMSGFLHAMTLHSPYQEAAGPFAGPVGYEKWIQPEPLVMESQPASGRGGG